MKVLKVGPDASCDPDDGTKFFTKNKFFSSPKHSSLKPSSAHLKCEYQVLSAN